MDEPAGGARRTRVLHAINSAALGGGPQHVFDLITGLPKDGYEFHVAVSDDGPFAERFRSAGALVHPVDMMSRRIQFRAARELRRIAEEIRPDLVHAHGTRAAFFVARALPAREGPRVVYTTHGLALHLGAGPFQRPFYLRVERSLCDRFDAVITLSEDDARGMVERGLLRDCSKMRVIPNGIRLEKFPPVGPSKAEVPVIGTVGRFVPQKGLSLLIEALAILKGAGSTPFRAILAGDGPERAHLQRLAARRGFADRIEWPGAVEDAAAWYPKFSLFVLVSLWEGFSLSMLEAMATGVPVIATEGCGMGELLRHGETGMRVPNGDAPTLAAALRRALEDPRGAQRMAERARVLLRERFTLEAFTGATEKVYRDLLGAGR